MTALAHAPLPSRVATLNLLKGGGRRVHAARVLADVRAELLLLQEAAALDDDVGAVRAWRAVEGRAWGSAIVATHGRLEPLDVPGFEGWVVAARWHRFAQAALTVVAVHVPHGPGSYVGSLRRILASLPLDAGDACLIGGDFNVCISPRRHAGGTARAGELEIQARLRDEFGLVSCWDALHPRRAPPQTLRWTGNREVPYHCDALFVPMAWTDRLRACVVCSSARWRARSDHYPVVATFGASRA
ncbi:MAG TPA: endonuclease/exonuclease/phosphatase family protein [Caldimonas sp.]|nr:endonuclease/exonuclease/phosphatase family protein [Caldimonas sp.]